MSPQAASSAKWDFLPAQEPDRAVVSLGEAANRLGYSRPGVERAVQAGRLEGCRVPHGESFKVAVYVDALRDYPTRPSRADRTAPQQQPDVTATILRLVNSIEQYEDSGRSVAVARALIDAARRELDKAADQRSAATAVLRELAEQTLMPDNVSDLLDRLGDSSSNSS